MLSLKHSHQISQQGRAGKDVSNRSSPVLLGYMQTKDKSPALALRTSKHRF
jgi:hypothetical protein